MQKTESMGLQPDNDPKVVTTRAIVAYVIVLFALTVVLLLIARRPLPDDTLSLEGGVALLVGTIILVAVIFGPIWYMAQAWPQVDEDEEKGREYEAMASRVIGVVSVIVWAALIFSNLLSMLWPGSRFSWPNGWFINVPILGYALIGAAVNIIVTQSLRTSTRDPKSEYAGRQMLRILEATVFAAVVYQVGLLVLPTVNKDCAVEASGQQCLSIDAPIFLIIALLVGLLVTLIEDFMVRLLPLGNWRANIQEAHELRGRYQKVRKRWIRFAEDHRREYEDDQWDELWGEFEATCNKIDHLLRSSENYHAAKLIHEQEMILLGLRFQHPDEEEE
ncbi:MAG: hypothetical protein JSW55_05095 [Chloroflexota bacterium]|nr:MAG: hypothetical protein JSW55_05095 [Chloroflexota bacterium]